MTLEERQAFQRRHGIIGSSVAMQEIIEVLMQVAPTDLTVLVTGESGVGKEVIAKAIHSASKRASKPMISVNAGAIPEGIIESELFGHEKGAFTGASDAHKGYFELADQGTLFLDEIGELPTGTQVKFLRVLENGEFMRVGSGSQKKVDVRVIAATNKDLEEEVRRGNFREDLFFRVRSINIKIPPLRERREDIPALFDDYAAQVVERDKIIFLGVTPEAMRLLLNYSWPGNVRELRNVVESMLIVESGKKIDADIVRKYIRVSDPAGSDRNLPVPTRRSPEEVERELIYRALLEVKSDLVEIKTMLGRGGMSSVSREALSNARVSGAAHVLSEDVAVDSETQPVHTNGDQVVALDQMEKQLILASIERNGGNRRLAARELNISERTLYRKIKEYGLG
jgi:DNA-binding NtrC family response regulator